MYESVVSWLWNANGEYLIWWNAQSLGRCLSFGQRGGDRQRSERFLSVGCALLSPDVLWKWQKAEVLDDVNINMIDCSNINITSGQNLLIFWMCTSLSYKDSPSSETPCSWKLKSLLAEVPWKVSWTYFTEFSFNISSIRRFSYRLSLITNSNTA